MTNPYSSRHDMNYCFVHSISFLIKIKRTKLKCKEIYKEASSLNNNKNNNESTSKIFL